MLRLILGAARAEHVCLVGNGAQLCAAELVTLGADASAATVLGVQTPTARGLAALAERATPAAPAELDTLEPVYLRGV
jgi:hypothetical protein